VARDLILHSSRKGKSHEQHHLYRRPGRCHHRGLVVFWTTLRQRRSIHIEGFRKALRRSSRTRRSPSGHRNETGTPYPAEKSSACKPHPRGRGLQRCSQGTQGKVLRTALPAPRVNPKGSSETFPYSGMTPPRSDLENLRYRCLASPSPTPRYAPDPATPFITR